jgi:diguanylate cyclase (GGDEF)-like protein/PAS domain S-box-containing protein
MPESARSLAVLCDEEGVVVEVIDARLDLLRPPCVGADLGCVVAAGSEEKLAAFLRELHDQRFAFDWEINVDTTAGVALLHFAGSQVAAGRLVIAAQSQDAMVAILEGFATVNNELVNVVRALSGLRTAESSAKPSPVWLPEFTRLNNELVNLQRELALNNAELERSRRLAQSILDTTPNLVYIYDLLEGRNVYVSRGSRAVLGFDPEEPAAFDLVGPPALAGRGETEDRAAWLEALSATADGQVLEREFRVKHASGEWRWLTSRETVFSRDRDGRPLQVIGTAQDVTSRHELEEQLKQLALVDKLTGLYNRRGFRSFASQAIRHAARLGTAVGLLYCDLDGLKAINDRLGHAEGDRAIRDVADVLQTATRSADIVGRLGGDEFAVLTLAASDAGLEAFRRRLYADVETLNDAQQRPYALSVSVGLTCCEAAATCRLDDLIAAADGQMFEEKKRRRGPRAGDGAQDAE